MMGTGAQKEVPVQMVGWSVEGILHNGQPRAAWWADDATRAYPRCP